MEVLYKEKRKEGAVRQNDNVARTLWIQFLGNRSMSGYFL